MHENVAGLYLGVGVWGNAGVYATLENVLTTLSKPAHVKLAKLLVYVGNKTKHVYINWPRFHTCCLQVFSSK